MARRAATFVSMLALALAAGASHRRMTGPAVATGAAVATTSTGTTATSSSLLLEAFSLRFPTSRRRLFRRHRRVVDTEDAVVAAAAVAVEAVEAVAQA